MPSAADNLEEEEGDEVKLKQVLFAIPLSFALTFACGASLAALGKVQ